MNVLCGALSLVVLAAGSAAALTLEDAVRLAVTNNPGLAAARQQVVAAGGRANQARLWPNPELELSAEDMPTRGGGLSASVNMIGVAQTVPFPGKKALDARIGQREVTAAEHEYRLRERELVRDVKAAFCRALAAEKKLGVSRELLDLAESLSKVAAQRVAAGATGPQESLRAEIETERARVEWTAEERERAEALQELAALLGRPSGPLPVLQGELTDAARPAAAPDHPGLAAARANKERAELDDQRAKLDPWPDVTFGVAGGRDMATKEDMLMFRVSLPLPLFDRGQGRQRETRARAEAARHDAAATEQRLSREFAVANARLRAATEQVAAYRARILPKAEEALKLVRGGFEAGKFGFLDLVDTQRTLAEARRTYWDKLLELHLALADLEALAGAQPQKE
jgi:cobalt-zinc-cadmium efflux system outer membrane protein